MSDESTGLEKAAPRTPAIITTPDEYRGALLRWQAQHFNVLTPFTNISGLAPQHGIITSLIQVSPEKAVGEAYDGLPFLKAGEVALAKVGLRKLAECAGISTDTTRTDPRTIPHYWEFQATAKYRGIDGAVVTRTATKEWDLRDGSPQLKGWTANQIDEGRKHGLRNCEARAINAAIRECGCGIKQKYTREELKKPFVVCRVMFQPDFSDPDIKRLVTERALGGTSMMYPAAARELPPAEVVDAPPAAEAGPRSVGRGTTAAAPPEPAPDQPPVEGAVRIVKVETKPWTKSGRSGERFIITDNYGVMLSTFDKGHREDAKRFCVDGGTGDWVEIITERSGDFVNIVEIVKAGSEPVLPGLDEI